MPARFPRLLALRLAATGAGLLITACNDSTSKSLVDLDAGFASSVPDRDQGGYTIEPGLGGMMGAGGVGGGGGTGGASDADAAVFWEADAAATPAAGPCTDGEQQACEAEGCVGGLQVCRNSVWSRCSPPPEQCNDRDDDCDGEIDENFPSVGQTCQAGGDCQGEGTFACSADGSGVECQLPPGAGGTPEVCDGLDNDCDGVIDEEFPEERCCQRSADCAPGQTCDATGHCTGGDTPVDPADPGGGLDFGNAPLAPPGAACATARDIPGPGEYPGATAGNGDEGMCTFLPTGGGEMAFTLTRDVDTEIRLYAFGDLFVNTVLYVRTDCEDALSEVACNDDTESDIFNFDAETSFIAEAGQNYAVIVDSWGAGGTFTLIVDERSVGGPGPGPDPQDPDAGVPPPPPPPAEPVGTCAAPLEFGPDGSVAGDTERGASALRVACSDTGGAPETIVHYRIDHPARVSFSTQGSDFDTVLAIRTTCDAVDSEFTCNDDNGGGGQWSAVAADLNPDVDYFIVVDGYGAGSGGFTLTVHEDFAEACSPNGSGCMAGEACFATACAPLPAGLCAAATPLRPQVGARGTLDAADVDALPSVAGCGGQHGADQVFAFVPEADGAVDVTTAESEVDTVLSVYDTCGAQVGGPGECNDDGALAGDSLVTFDAVGGHMYFAVVEGYHGARGDFVVRYQPAR